MSARPLRALTLLVAVLGLPAAVAGQDEVIGTLSGFARLGQSFPDSGWVTLHRVQAETAGPVDSVRVGAEGTFSFDLPALPDPGGAADVYIGSMRWDGIMYFGPPVNTVVQLDSAYVIDVYPTRRVTEGEARVRVDRRTLVFDRTPPGWTVTELLVIENPSDSTLITGVGGAPTFAHPLPATASDLQVGDSDLAPQGAAIVDGALWVASPIPPGPLAYHFQYLTTDSAFTIPSVAVADTLELFVAEPAPPLDVEGLVSAGVVQDGGRAYRMWTGGAEVGTIGLEPGSLQQPERLPVEALVVALALILAVAGILAMSRNRASPAAR